MTGADVRQAFGFQTAFEDPFVLERFPPHALWPEGVAPSRATPFNLAAWLHGRAKRGGWLDRPAILSADRCCTYAELFSGAGRLARVLVERHGLVPGGRVLLRGYNGADLIMLWLAVVWAGGVAVTTIPLMRPKELGDVLRIGNIRLAVCQTGLAGELEEAVANEGAALQLLTYDDDVMQALAANAGGLLPYCPNFIDDPCILGFTSGTTGDPKATIHSHGNLRAAFRTTGQHVIGLDSNDVVLCAAPLGFTFGLSAGLLYPFASGAAVIPVTQPVPEMLQEASKRFGTTISFGSPLLYRRLLANFDAGSWSKLRASWSGGDMLQVDLQHAWRATAGVALCNLFGTTELFHAILSSSADAIALRPARGYKAAIADQDGRIKRRGIGMLAIKGPTGCRYLNDPRQRQYVSDGWNITGDRATIAPDSSIEIAGRADDVIVSAGYNLSGAEVEEALLRHRDVSECAIVGEPHPERGQIVVAYVVLREGAARNPATAAALQDHVKAQLSPYKYPRRIVFLDALPRGATGKVQKFRLAAGA